MTEDTTATKTTKLNLELIIDDEKWDVIIGMQPEFRSSEYSWFPDPYNKKLYIGKFLVASLDNIKHSCWSTYHKGEVRNYHYF